MHLTISSHVDLFSTACLSVHTRPRRITAIGATRFKLLIAAGMAQDSGFNIRGIEQADYQYIVSVLDRWWGGPAGQRAEPYFFYEFGDHALIAEAQGKVIGFLLGFSRIDVDAPLAYVHLVGIDPAHRRRGVGKALYQAFTRSAEKRGASVLRAISMSGDDASTLFHRALGFEVREAVDYAGPGRSRTVYEKAL